MISVAWTILKAAPFRDCAFDSGPLLQVTSLISSLLFLLFSLPSTTFPSLDKLYKSLVRKNLGVPGQRLSNFSLHQNHLELVQPQPSGPPQCLWFSKSGVGPGNAFCTCSQVMLLLLVQEPQFSRTTIRGPGYVKSGPGTWEYLIAWEKCRISGPPLLSHCG